MFEELRKRIKNGYFSFLAKRYIRNLSKKDSSKELSLDVVPEEVKYKVLEEGLTEDKDLIYSLIMNLKSKEQRQEMIKKYISEDKYPDIDVIMDLPEPLKLEILDDKLMGYYTWDIKKILDSLSDEGVVRLIESNKNGLDIRLNSEREMSSLEQSGTTKVEEYFESILYDRYQRIQSEEIKERFNELISVDALTNRIEDKILGVVGYRADDFVIDNLDRIKSEDKKIKYLAGKRHESTLFVKLYRSLSEEGKREVLNNIVFSKESISRYVSERRREHRKQKFSQYLVDYLEFAEIDLETVEDLYYVLSENSSERIHLYNMVDDNGKAKLILNERNYPDATNRRTDMLFVIEDEDVLINTIHEYGNIIDTTNNCDRNVLYEYFLSKMDDETKAKVVSNEISLGKDVNLNLLVRTLKEVNDKDILREILSSGIDFTEDHFRYNSEKGLTTIDTIIAEKIVEHDLSEELLNSTNINNFSEETKFLLLLNSSKETREKILEKHEELKDIIDTINENETSLKTLSDGTSSSVGRLTFYKRLIKEIKTQKRNKEREEEQTNNETTNEENNYTRSYSISEKLAFLEKFQGKHASIGETILFDFLDDEILNEFGGLENVENLVRYPNVQNLILKVDKEHLKVIRHINNYVSDNLPNADYILAEVLSEYFDSYKGWDDKVRLYPAAGGIYSAVAEYISSHDEIPEEMNKKIFNIITNARSYDQMFRELGRDMTVEDVENIEEVEDKFFDSIITGENTDTKFSVKGAYLLKYYNISYDEAEEKVTEYMEFIESLDDSPENIALKKYIFALHNVINSNTEILSAAYQISKGADTISRMEIEKIESRVKEKIAEEIKDTLYKPGEEKLGTTSIVLEDGKEYTVDVYEAKDDFNMLVTVLDAYGGGDGVYENYEEQWNTNKYAQNQRICTTYIGNNSLKTVKRNNCVIYGFTEFANSALVKMAPYDIVSKNDGLVTTSRRDAICMGPKELINQTRRYNELDIERSDSNGNKIQPSYIICFAKSLDEVNEESKKAAAQFGIPIVLIDREKIAERETEKINETLQRFTEEKDLSLIDNIIEEFCNNKYGSTTTVRDKKEAEEQGKEIVDVEAKYFSDERLVEILQTMIDVAKAEEAAGNIEKSKEILNTIKEAVIKEGKKHELWQRKFGALMTHSPFEAEIFKDIIDQIETPADERARMDEKKVKEKLDFLTRFDGDKNKVELAKRREVFREDAYTMSDVQDEIRNFTVEELEMICDYTYRDDTIQNMYTLMLGKAVGLDYDKIRLMIEATKKGYDTGNVEGYTDEENKLISKLNEIERETPFSVGLMIGLIENPVENKMKESEDITNQIFDAAIQKGIINQDDIDIENLSLEEKIEILKDQDASKMYTVINNIREREPNKERSDKIHQIQHYFSFTMSSRENVFKYMLSLPKEEQEEFILMAKVMKDAGQLALVAERQEQIGIKIEPMLEEGEKYLPTAFQIQEAFANQRLDEVIAKEGYEKDKDRIKEKLAEGGRSPIEYAYELNRFLEKKKVNEKGEEK